jgi:hypothetical protein
MTLSIKYRCLAELLLAREYPFEGFIKFSTDREQDFCSNFVASVLDGRQITLANTDSTSKICLRNIESPRPPTPSPRLLSKQGGANSAMQIMSRRSH